MLTLTKNPETSALPRQAPPIGRTLKNYQITSITILTLALLSLILPGCQGPGHLNRTEANRRSAEVQNAEVERLLLKAENARAVGDDDAALEALALAVEINPELFNAHLGMADIYRERGDNEYAIKQYRNATEINADSYEANYFLGLCLQLTNRLAEAIRSYRRAIAIDPNSHEAHLNVATAYLQNTQPIEALPFARRAAELQPEHGPTHINLAAIYAALGKHQAAVREYLIASELIELPNNVLLNFADSLRVLKRYPEMINALTALLRVEPVTAAYERLGYAYFKTGDFEKSKTAYRQAVATDEEYYPALNGLAVNLLNEYILSGHTQINHRDEAVKLLRKSVRLEGDQPRIIDLLSRYGR